MILPKAIKRSEAAVARAVSEATAVPLAENAVSKKEIVSHLSIALLSRLTFMYELNADEDFRRRSYVAVASSKLLMYCA